MKTTFLAIAKDPSIIPGVHHHCDEWCDYCPLTARCLTFRCTAEFRKQRGRTGAETFESLDEIVQFTRDVAAAEGAKTHELDELVAHPGRSGIKTADPLAERALGFAASVEAAIGPRILTIASAPVQQPEPPPETILVYCHLRIYMRVFRALVARDRERAGLPVTEDEALGSAKLALAMIERTKRALQQLREMVEDAEDAAVSDHFIVTLEEIECGLDERFPAARHFVRLGLDCPMA